MVIYVNIRSYFFKSHFKVVESTLLLSKLWNQISHSFFDWIKCKENVPFDKLITTNICLGGEDNPPKSFQYRPREEHTYFINRMAMTKNYFIVMMGQLSQQFFSLITLHIANMLRMR